MNSRRDFIKTAALTAIASATAARAVAAGSPLPRDRRLTDAGKRVELAIATICVDGFGDHNFEPSFELIPKIGFRNVEFNVWYPRNLTPSGIESIRERCATTGLRPVCLQGSAFGTPEGASILKDVTHKLWLMQQAKELGCRRVKFTGARRGTKGGLDAVIDTLKELAPAAEEMDVLILVENHANNNLENIADYDRLFEEIDSPHVGLCLDTGHFVGAAVELDEVIERFHSRTLHVDLKDCASFGTYKTVRYGEGVAKVPAVVEKMLERGYAGYLVVEQAPPLRPEFLEQDLKAAYELFAPYTS